MPVLVDGNNLLHRLPGIRSRVEVRRLALELVRRERTRVTVVFDGPPPPGSPDHERLGKVTIIWAGATSADDRIIRCLPDRRQAGSWTVVTDDRGLATRARHHGAVVQAVAAWRSKLHQPAPKQQQKQEQLSAAEVAEWQAYFESGGTE